MGIQAPDIIPEFHNDFSKTSLHIGNFEDLIKANEINEAGKSSPNIHTAHFVENPA